MNEYDVYIDLIFGTHGMWFLICMGAAVILALLSTVFLCLWIRRDAKNNGIDPGLWIVLAFFTGILGIILYFTIGRKQTKTKCPRCFQSVNPENPLCLHCGQPISPENIIGYEVYAFQKTEKRSTTGLMVSFIVTFVLSVLLVFGGIFGYIGSTFVNLTDYYSSSVTETPAELDYFEISFTEPQKQMIERSLIRSNGNPNEVYVDYFVGKGTLYMTVVQGDMEETYEISGRGEGNYFELSAFKNGRIAILIDGSEAQNVDMLFYW